jgi:hypothetical protein
MLTTRLREFWHSLKSTRTAGRRPERHVGLAIERLEDRTVPASLSWNGTNMYLLGINYPWHDYAVDFGNGPWGHFFNPANIQQDFQQMAANGVQEMRWWVCGDGRYAPLFDGAGNVTGFDAQFFGDLDTALQIAKNYNIKVELTLVDFGMIDPAQIVNGVQLGGHANLFTDPTVRQSYLDNALKPLLQHIAGSVYNNTVFDYDIINEPEWRVNFPGFQGNPVIPYADMQAFIQLSAQYIHAYGGGALASVGSAKGKWASAWNGLGLDFHGVHYYPGFDTAGPGSGLLPVSALGLDGPAVLEEFATNDVSYGFTDTAPQSAEWYLDSAQQLGYAGALGWSFNADNIQSGGTVSDWIDFAPVLKNWSQLHSGISGAGDAVGTFFTDANHQLWLYNPLTRTFTNTGGFALTFAAGLDAQGRPEVWFTDGINQLWRWDNGVFTNTGGFATRISAGRGFVAFTDGINQLWFYSDTQGFTDTGGFATIFNVGFDRSGTNQVAFLDGVQRLYTYNASTGAFTNTGGFATQITSARDALGNNEVFFLDGNHQIYRYDQGQFTATGGYAQPNRFVGSQGGLFFLDGTNELWRYDDSSGFINTGGFAGLISGSPGTNAVFFLDGVNQIWEYQNGIATNTGAFGFQLSAF